MLIVFIFISLVCFGCTKSGGYLYPKYPEYNALDYVKLGDYKHLVVSVEPEIQITESMLDEQMNMYVANRIGMSQQKSGTADYDCYVNVSYECFFEGDKLEELSSDEDHIYLDSDKEVYGFEDKIVGMNVGDTQEFDFTFPDDFQLSDYQNKTVHYVLTLNALETYPEITDDVVNIASDGVYTSITDLREYLKAEGEEYYQSEYDDRVKLAVQTKLKDICEIIEIPEFLQNWYVQTQLAFIEDEVSKMGLSMDQYLNQEDLTIESLTQKIEADSENGLSIELIAHGIGDKEHLVVPDDFYQEKLQVYADNYGYSDVNDFLKSYGESIVNNDIYVQYVLDWITNRTTIKKKPTA